MDPSGNQVREKIESNWIKTLRTACPDGLIDQVQDDYRKDETKLVGVDFQFLVRLHSITRVIEYSY